MTSGFEITSMIMTHLMPTQPWNQRGGGFAPDGSQLGGMKISSYLET